MRRGSRSTRAPASFRARQRAPGRGAWRCGCMSPRFRRTTPRRTFPFTVYSPIYAQDFEGARARTGGHSPETGQCGTPSNVGPSAAFSGSACLGTQLAGDYSANQSWNSATGHVSRHRSEPGAPSSSSISDVAQHGGRGIRWCESESQHRWGGRPGRTVTSVIPECPLGDRRRERVGWKRVVFGLAARDRGSQPVCRDDGAPALFILQRRHKQLSGRVHRRRAW